jgi:uncharacterized protein involved in exopolysaccharide biosynthesis
MTSLAPEDDASEAEDAVNVREIARFGLEAARRHWRLGLIVGVLVAALGITAALVLPPMYEARSKVYVAQEGAVTETMSTGRSLPHGDPTQGVSEKVTRGENLRAVVQEADLERRWELHRPAVLRLKDRITAPLRDLPPDMRTRVLAGVLADRLAVYTEGRTIHFVVAWRDPETAALIANVTQRRFLHERLQEQVSVITAAIDILEKEVKQAGAAIEPQLKVVEARYHEAREALRKPRDTAQASPPPVVAYKSASKASRPSEPDPSLTEQLGKIRQGIREIQEPWERRLAELKLQLTDLRSVYGPMHPQVVQQERRIETASSPPSQLAKLRDEERQLLDRIQVMSVPAPEETRRLAVRLPTTTSEGPDEGPAPDPNAVHDSATISAARSKLVAAIQRYNDLTARLDGARLELITAETAFKYRYVILAEAEPPPGPLKPRRPLFIVLGSIVAALALGLVAGAARELATGRMLDVWQVRKLGLPLLADIDFRRKSPTRG